MKGARIFGGLVFTGMVMFSEVTTALAQQADLQPPSPAQEAPSCLDIKLQKRDYSAETECQFYAAFQIGGELLGSKNFVDLFPRVAVSVRERFYEQKIPQDAGVQLGIRGIHGILDFGLTSRVVPDAGAQFRVEGSKVLEGRGGLLFNFADFYGSNGGHVSANTSLGILAELGFITAEAGQDKAFRIFQNHFLGLRSLHRGNDKFNGAYVDLGWSVRSENFPEHQYRRIKFRGYLPYQIAANSPTKLFVAIGVDSDMASQPDEVKLMFGIATTVQNAFSFVLPEGLMKLVSAQ